MPVTSIEEGLLARVERQLYRYAAALDEGDLEAWPGFFEPEALYRLVPRENHDRGLPASLMHCRGQAMMRDRVAAIRQASVFSPHVCRHLYANLRLEDDGEPGITLYANYVVYRTATDGDTALFSVGRVMARVGGGEEPLFQAMTVVYDTLRIPGLLVYPI